MSTGINAVKRTSTVIRKMAVVTDVVEVYKQAISKQRKKFTDLLNSNKPLQYILIVPYYFTIEKLDDVRKSELARKIEVAKGFYRVEIAPPTTAEEMMKLRTDIRVLIEFMRSGCYRYLTVKQAWLLFLVGTEVTLWFFLGETIGKMHLVGYKV
ncbi:probable ATP synthase subunit g 1, mitochondrial isoform X1 [Manduca sexta]|uniref:probable ATP synthase subunit g 1, mitochondrial isoform X1 n=1 Tax=Manduca sexta TaxID=7130 RepID=UPI0018903F46|nr:probable ATP synthase subunit g 1, mitochondrial isoform X1 [Manduca sexta]